MCTLSPLLSCVLSAAPVCAVVLCVALLRAAPSLCYSDSNKGSFSPQINNVVAKAGEVNFGPAAGGVLVVCQQKGAVAAVSGVKGREHMNRLLSRQPSFHVRPVLAIKTTR